MAESTTVRVKTRSSEFEITGSEEFVKDIWDRVTALIESEADAGPDDESDEPDEDEDAPTKKGKIVSLEDFVERYDLENDNVSGQMRALAMAFYVLKVKKQTEATVADVRKTFQESSVDEPDNLGTVVSNLRRQGYLKKGTNGDKITSNGSKAVRALAV